MLIIFLGIELNNFIGFEIQHWPKQERSKPSSKSLLYSIYCENYVARTTPPHHQEALIYAHEN